MLRSDYKYSREPSMESSSVEKSSDIGAGSSSDGKEASGGFASGTASDGGRRSSSMKHWSPLAALGKRARAGLRRCNTVRTGLGWGGSASGSVGTDYGDNDDTDRGRRNAMPNIFLGLPSSGVRRLFAVYGIDEARSSVRVARVSHSALSSPAAAAATAATSTSRGAEESLFARHTRTSSVRSRPPSYVGMGAMQQQYIMLHHQHQQHQQQQQLQLQYPHHQGQLDRRRASSMRDHGKRHQYSMSSYGNR